MTTSSSRHRLARQHLDWHIKECLANTPQGLTAEQISERIRRRAGYRFLPGTILSYNDRQLNRLGTAPLREVLVDHSTGRKYTIDPAYYQKVGSRCNVGTPPGRQPIYHSPRHKYHRNWQRQYQSLRREFRDYLRQTIQTGEAPDIDQFLTDLPMGSQIRPKRETLARWYQRYTKALTKHQVKD